MVTIEENISEKSHVPKTRPRFLKRLQSTVSMSSSNTQKYSEHEVQEMREKKKAIEDLNLDCTLQQKDMIHPELALSRTVNWLRRRKFPAVKNYYVEDRRQLELEIDIKDVFSRIDVENKSFIDALDLLKLFEGTNLKVDLADVELFIA